MNPEAITVTDCPPDSNSVLIPVLSLVPSTTNARKHYGTAELSALVKAIKDNGFTQAILARVHPSQPGKYEIIAGERRFRAAQKAGLAAVQCRILAADDRAALVIQADENLVRENLNPLEEAATYKKLMDSAGFTQEQLAEKYQRHQSYISNRLRLLNLPKTWKRKLITGAVPVTFGRDLATFIKYPQIYEPLEQAVERMRRHLEPGVEPELSDYRAALADAITEVAADIKAAAALAITKALRAELEVVAMPETLFPRGTEFIFNTARLAELLAEYEIDNQEMDTGAPHQLDEAPLFDPEEMGPETGPGYENLFYDDPENGPGGPAADPEETPGRTVEEMKASATHAQEVAERNKTAAGPGVDYAEYFLDCVSRMILKRLNAREPVFLKQVSRLPQFWNTWKPDEPFLKLHSHAQLIELAREWGLDMARLDGYETATQAMVEEIMIMTAQKRIDFGEEPHHRIGPPLGLIMEGTANIKDGVEVTA